MNVRVCFTCARVGSVVASFALLRALRVALRAPGGSAAPRAVAHHRPPRVLALQALPQRLVVRRFRHRSRLLIRVDVFQQELFPSLAVLLAPHVKVVSFGHHRVTPLTSRKTTLRAPAGFDAPRAVAHHRPPLVLAIFTFPQCFVLRSIRYLRLLHLLGVVLPKQSRPSLAVLVAPLLERFAPAYWAPHDRPAGVRARAPRSDDEIHDEPNLRK